MNGLCNVESISVWKNEFFHDSSWFSVRRIDKVKASIDLNGQDHRRVVRNGKREYLRYGGDHWSFKPSAVKKHETRNKNVFLDVPTVVCSFRKQSTHTANRNFVSTQTFRKTNTVCFAKQKNNCFLFLWNRRNSQKSVSVSRFAFDCCVRWGLDNLIEKKVVCSPSPGPLGLGDDLVGCLPYSPVIGCFSCRHNLLKRPIGCPIRRHYNEIHSSCVF